VKMIWPPPGDKGQLDPVPDAALAEVPVSKEGELDRGDRALDRHVDDVDRDPPAVEPGQRVPQCRGSGRLVEGERLTRAIASARP